MLADVGARLQSVLAELRRLPGILGVTIARRDGILIAHSLPKTMDPKKIAAMAAAIVGTSEMAAVEMGLGSFNQSIVDTHIGMMMATGDGDDPAGPRPVREGDRGVGPWQVAEPRRGRRSSARRPRLRRRELGARPHRART